MKAIHHAIFIFSTLIIISITANGQTVEEYIQRAKSEMNSENFPNAISTLSNGISKYPNNDELLLLRGVIKAHLRDFRGAYLDYSLAMQYRRTVELWSLYRFRGMAAGQLGDNSHAIEDYTASLKLNPTFSENYFFRGLLYAANGNMNAACWDFSKAGELGYSDAYIEIQRSCQ